MNPDIMKVHLDWCMDILRRINQTAQDPHTPIENKLHTITWLSKQGLKVEREE